MTERTKNEEWKSWGKGNRRKTKGKHRSVFFFALFVSICCTPLFHFNRCPLIFTNSDFIMRTSFAFMLMENSTKPLNVLSMWSFFVQITGFIQFDWWLSGIMNAKSCFSLAQMSAHVNWKSVKAEGDIENDRLNVAWEWGRNGERTERENKFHAGKKGIK